MDMFPLYNQRKDRGLSQRVCRTKHNQDVLMMITDHVQIFINSDPLIYGCVDKLPTGGRCRATKTPFILKAP